ncbi:DUF4433 domain-containing protein [Haloechinothrix sp. LS1_15]|nr:DUF4433 domain-containing protein [Haloechinothrix sp. LS1_15]
MRPQPTTLYHFTHVDHLAEIARRGLLADSAIQGSGLLRAEVGHMNIKDRRRSTAVRIPREVSSPITFPSTTRRVAR